ncbi:penicillin-binding protein activator [Celeribacter litoreus]|uniref:penicillin-binding protein activator n=1 Tax=Celeribacter litoreus TaxID=2876714 RepID=UPI001CCE1779|nr:penicillin-binding protein activator [Celeribacter litoreus]MCA0042685.1 penicillin-binding protein activator [Celeribacter litoreus]
MFAVLRAARKSLAKITLGLSVLALAACEPGAFPVGGGPVINTRAPVPVALLVPYDSQTPGDIVVAQSLENAARLAIADLDGAQIDLRVYPTSGIAEGASVAASLAVKDGAKIILGPVYGGSAQLAGLPARNAGINVLSFSNNPDVAGGNVFILGPTFENTADRLVSYARAQGKNQIMLVNGNSPAEIAGANAIKGAIAGNGASLVAEQSFELTQQAVIQAIRPIVSTARETGADTVFFTSGNDGAMPLLAQMLPENGMTSPDPQFVGLQRWNVPSSALTLPGLQNSWFAIPDQMLTANFSSRYTAAYGEPPHALAGLAYDGIAAIGALVEAGDQNALTAQGLTRGSGFVGVNGIFRLLPDGTNQRGLSVATIQDNQVVEIDPAPRAFAGTGF